MNPYYNENCPQFFTSTIDGWKFLLQHETCKQIIIATLKFLKENQRARIFAFVLMSNHVHLIWQSMKGHNIRDIQNSFSRHTGKQFAKFVKSQNIAGDYISPEAYDRAFTFWKRNSLSVDLVTPEVFAQKLEYIHSNPVRAGVCENPNDYVYSSAEFYSTGRDRFGFLEHWHA